MSDVKYPKRKRLRLEGYDYSRPNAYLITICAYRFKQVFGRIIPGDDLSPAVCALSEYGAIAEKELLALENRFFNITVDNYVIMPNHMHVLLTIHASEGEHARQGIPAIIRAFKSLTTRSCRKAGFAEPYLFQDSYHDEIIRDEAHYRNSWHYIDINPAKWVLDRYYNER